MRAAFRRILRLVENAEGAVCAVGLFVTSVLIFAQVVNRYFLHFEIMWFSDLALYIFIFFMLLAAAYTTWREGHVAVDFLRGKIVKDKPVSAAVYRVVLDLMSIAALGAILPAAFRFLKRALKYPEYGTLVRWFNTSWLQITLLIALVLVLMHLVVILGTDIGDLYQKTRSERAKGEE